MSDTDVNSSIRNTILTLWVITDLINNVQVETECLSRKVQNVRSVATMVEFLPLCFSSDFLLPVVF